MHTIKALQSFPNGTPIDQIQVRITRTFERKETKDNGYGPGTIQNGEVQDSTGSMRLKVWHHPDIASMEGKDVVISAAKGKGLKVTVGEYQGQPQIALEVGKQATFQLIGVQTPSAPQNAPKAKETASVGLPAGKFVSREDGMRVGMAINNAVAIINAGSHDAAMRLAQDGKLTEVIVKVASQIIAASVRLEQDEKPEPKPQPKAPTIPEDAPSEDQPF